MNDPKCVECGRGVVILSGGTALHRLPTPEDLTTVEGQRRWGLETGFFTLATVGHDARVINDYAMDPRD